MQTHAKIIGLAQTNLRSTRQTYIDNVFLAQVDENTWTVGLREDAMWIEEGLEPRSMVMDLLKGREYRAIPMEQAKAPTETPIAQANLSQTLKTELKKRKIPLRKIERNPDGSPKLGLIHKMDIDTKEKGPTGISYLQGVRIYQRQDRANPEKINKFIGTFRMVSKKHIAQGRWFHPGLESRKFVDKAFQWAISEWDDVILPAIRGGGL